MAYNSSKGPQTHGDVKYEGDAEDTQIDFENDFVAIKTNGVQRLIVNSNTVTSSVALSCSLGITGSTLDVGNFTTVIDSTHVSSSLSVSASSFWANGVEITSGGGGAVSNYNNAADNRVITSVDSNTIQGEAGLTFDGSLLTVAGDINMSGMTGSAISGTLSVFDLQNGKVQIGNEEAGTGVMVKIRAVTDSDVPLIVKSPSHDSILAVTGSGKVAVGGVYVDAKFNITGSNEEKFLAIKSTDVNPVLEVDNNHLSASVNISASAFFGSGQHLTNLPSAAITTYNSAADNRIITSVNSTTVQGESGLTFDGSVLNVTGDVSGSGVLSANEIKCSGSVTAVSFAGDGSALTGLPSAAISTYNTSGDNRIITSVNSSTVQGESRLTFDGETLYVSGNMKMQNNQPRLEFSNSAGTGLGLVGYNNSDNILIQNDTTNKHIVFKANDNGTIREGLRVDGAVPEVVVNQGSDSLVDFRVESDNNTHMIFVDGANDKVGINTDAPSHPLSVIGHVSASLGITGSSIHAGDFTTVINSTHVSSSVSISASSFWANGVQLTAGGGGGSPGGSDGQVQYNNGGSFGGESNFVYDDGNDRVGIGTSAPSHTLSVTGSAQISSNLTVSGSLRTAGTLYTTYHAFNYGGTAAPFIPFIGNVESTNGDYRMQMIAPFPGRLMRVIARTKNTMNGFCTASVMVAGDTVEDFLAGGASMEDVSASMDAANTSYNFNFTGSSHYAAGNIIGVKFKFKNNPGDVNMTCIWEHDQTSI